VQHGLGRKAAVVAARTAEPGWVFLRDPAAASRRQELHIRRHILHRDDPGRCRQRGWDTKCRVLFGTKARRTAVDLDRPKGRLGAFFEGKHVADNPEETVELAGRLARLQPSGLTSCSTTDVEMRPSATQISRMGETPQSRVLESHEKCGSCKTIRRRLKRLYSCYAKIYALRRHPLRLEAFLIPAATRRRPHAKNRLNGAKCLWLGRSGTSELFPSRIGAPAWVACSSAPCRTRSCSTAHTPSP